MASPNKLDTKRRRSFVLTKEHAQVTGDATVKIFKARKRCRIDRVDYINPTGLVGHATDAFAGYLKNGATTVATVFNTDTGDAGGATLAPDTFVTATLGTLAARTLAADDVLVFLLDEDGTATLEAGTFVIHFTELN